MMSGDKKRPGLLQRLFGFKSREAPKNKPPTPKPPKKEPPASKPSRKKSPERHRPPKKAEGTPPKLKVPPPAGPHQVDRGHERRPFPEPAAEAQASPPPHGPLTKKPREIQFGMLDGNAVRYTEHEAWWLVEGVWSRIHLAEVIDNAVVLSEARFNELFGDDVLQLPSAAFQP
jgi:hypothetical protein